MAGNVVDYGFYLIQRGEAGHRRGAYLNEYPDSGGIETIGYGTVTRPGYNHLNYRNTTITEEDAIALAKEEMAYKINEKCRTKFKDFDNLLPCYQAAILDTTYQGNWGSIQDAMNAHDMQAVYAAIINNPNRERAAVRGRAIEMGMLIEQALAANPNADPQVVAQLIAQQMIEQYAYLNGTDCALTKDELALMYRSCMAAYGREVDENEIEQFALNFNNVATGMCGIGSNQPAGLFNGMIPMGPGYDGSYSGLLNQDYVRNRGVSSSYRSIGDKYSGRQAPVPFLPAEIGPNRFQPDSKMLDVSTSDVSYNFSSREGKTPKMIVLHTTESSSYRSTKATFQSRDSKVSAHYVIDRDGTIHQYLPEGYSAWHAGESQFPPLGINGCCNADSIGIEIQRSPNEPLTKEQIASTMALVKDIKERHNIPAEHVVAHSDVAPGRKVDPGEDFPWRAFAREGLATMNHLGTGNTHAQHIDPTLENVSSADCAFYNKPDYIDSKKSEKEEEEKRKAEEIKQFSHNLHQKENKAVQTPVKSEESTLKQRLENASVAGKDAESTATTAHTEKTEKAASSQKPASGKGKKKSGKSAKSAKSGKGSATSSKKGEASAKSTENSSEKEIETPALPKKPIGENITKQEEAKKEVSPQKNVSTGRD